MDDLIYILLGVAWILYAAYRANQKQKKRPSPQVKPSVQPQRTFEQSPRSFETIFKDILGEGESSERPFIPEAESYNEVAIRELEQERNLFGKPKTILGSIPLEEGVSAFDYTTGYQAKRVIFGEEDTLQDILKEDVHFDLRKAVIYSAILNRPYQ